MIYWKQQHKRIHIQTSYIDTGHLLTHYLNVCGCSISFSRSCFAEVAEWVPGNQDHKRTVCSEMPTIQKTPVRYGCRVCFRCVALDWLSSFHCRLTEAPSRWSRCPFRCYGNRKVDRCLVVQHKPLYLVDWDNAWILDRQIALTLNRLWLLTYVM